MKKIIFTFAFIFIVPLLLLKISNGTNNINPKVITKLNLIDDELVSMGYSKYSVITISLKRPKWFNDLLFNSAKKSEHLKGNALDVWVLDVNGNFKLDDDDIDIVIQAVKNVENKYPELTGVLGTYRCKSKTGSRMIHTDVTGRNGFYCN